MIKIIPTKSIPNQGFSTVINGQQLTFTIYVRNNDHLYIDIYLQGEPLFLGIPCNHAIYLNAYNSEFVGYLFFYNTTEKDPVYQELGNTCNLYYADYDALEFDYANWKVLEAARLAKEAEEGGGG